MTSFFKKPKTLYDDPQNGARWYAEDLASAKAAIDKANAKNLETIKDAKLHGVKAAISSEAGKMLKPPPGYDPFNGKVCQGPGLVKAGFGRPKICGRQATIALQTAHFEPDIPRSASSELTEAALAYMAYGAGPNPIPAGSGPRKGKMVPDPNMPGPNSKFVCAYHAQALYRDALHPDDNNGIIPKAPKLTGDVVIGLDKLTPGHPFRCVSQDANFVWVTDGKVTVMAYKRDYVALLREYGLLPDDSTQPLP